MSRCHARGALVLVACLGFAGCGEEPIDPVPTVLTVENGPYSLVIQTNPLTMELRRNGEVLTTLDERSFVIGTVGELVDSTNYDPYPLLAETPGYLPPAHVEFRPVSRVLGAVSDDGGAALRLVHDGGFESELLIVPSGDATFRFSLTPLERGIVIVPSGDGTLRLSLTPVPPSEVAWIGIGATAAPDEAFYGLGEYFDDVNHRGKLRAMQIEVDELESGYNEAHAPVPFVIGTRGWGLFIESAYPGAFDVAALSDTRVRATFGLGSASSEGLVAHLFGAEHPMDVTKRYYAVTGAPELPAPWALGPLVWRDENEDQAQVESDLETMRDLDLPTNGIWIDRPYARAVNSFDFHSAQFPDPQAMIAKAHALGFRVALWHVPYLDEEHRSTKRLLEQAEARGFYPIETGLTFNQWGRPLDFTAPGAIDWWQDNLEAYTSMGIEGFKLDYAEDVVPGAFGVRNVYLFQDGSDERTMHRGYTLLYHQTYAEMLPEEGGLLLCRAAKWGDQKHGIVVWPGDLDARLWKHREQVTEGGETFKAVGGLHASMIAGLTLGPSGFPFYGSDTGGYRHSPPDAETFIRWFQQTALSSVMQIGTSSNDVAWELGDAELLDLYRAFTRLHLRLFPYTWTLAGEIATTGRPIQRSFGLQEPSYGEHPSDQYFYGDDLLVAPVTEKGQVARTVFFPEGRWFDFFDGSVIDGPGAFEVDAPLSKLPLYVRAGAIVPMLRPTIDTLSPTLEPDRVDSFANDAGDLFVLLAPLEGAGEQREAEVYDGSRIVFTNEETHVDVEVGGGEAFDQGAVLELVAFGENPSHIDLEGLTLEPSTSVDALLAAGQGYHFDAEDRGGTLTVKIALIGSGAMRRVRISRTM